MRFPRMLRWRTDKTIEEANTLADLDALLHTGSKNMAQAVTPYSGNESGTAGGAN